TRVAAIAARAEARIHPEARVRWPSSEFRSEWEGSRALRRRLVQEWDDRRGERRIAAHRVVRHARKDGEPGVRTARAVPPAVSLAAAKQAEHFHGVRGREHV